QPPPTPLASERDHPLWWRLGNHCEIELLNRVAGGTVELVEQSYTRRAGTFGQRKQCRLSARRARAVVAGVAGEHEAVDHERVFAVGKQTGQSHADGHP